MRNFYLNSTSVRKKVCTQLMLFRRHCTGFFPVQCCLEPRVLRQHWRRFFSCNVVWSLLDNIAQGFFSYFVQCCLKKKGNIEKDFSCAMLSAASRTTLHRVFPVEYCPKSIKTTLHRIFACAILSAASWATLHKVLTCAMLSQKYYGIIEQDFSHAMFSRASWTTLHKVFTCTMFLQEY